MMSIFNKGEGVEVIKQNENDEYSYFPATVLRPPSKNNNMVFVEYQAPTKSRNREYVNVASVRPKLPYELNPWFKVGDSVDAFRPNVTAFSWCPATVSDILENSTYRVDFRGHSAAVDHCSLRLHRDWVNGNWVPPLPQPQPQPPETVTRSEKIRIKIKCSRSPQKESEFFKGKIVEVSSDDEGYKGAWFVATIVDIIAKDKFLVEYRDLATEDGTQLLNEVIHERFIRPCPPEVPLAGSFKQFQEVDAWYNDGWWEGVVCEVRNGRECLVSFMNNDVMEFENSKLRPHQDWLDGKWVMSSKESSELVKKFGDVRPEANNLTGNKLIVKLKKSSDPAKRPRDVMERTPITRSKHMLQFCRGAKVEVRSDEEGYQGSWYTAIIVDPLQSSKYLVEYSTLKTDDLTEQLKEVAEAFNIRPCPPDTSGADCFLLHEWVDAWYNDGWWVGQVSRVLGGFKYMVYFWTSKEELEFEYSLLRPHQDWIDGKWVLASLDPRPVR
ncbi:protein AGENET DOMAIN (AGD)-CONTAINING P1-like isoform X2 [Lotus japonicus]|uniref:protein AGENET DOMAIN (AGD)-CONTAINING P1-like isoform X2 n=1 Tax=Lotus japonicus TaxID=34305 RepID=UPI00258C5388|nr:protein AGENET DOMAIN (AGD)-CONTAINING P1-like isoform X2 [Lotus japonicus]